MPAALPAQSLSDLREEQERLEAEQEANAEVRAAVAAELGIEQATAEEIAAALQAIRDDLESKQRRLRLAEDAYGRAIDQVTLARQEQERVDVEVDSLRDDLENLAVRAYVDPGDEDLVASLVSGDVMEASSRRVLLDATASVNFDVVDRFRAVREDAEQAEDLATDAVTLADERGDVAAALVTEVEAAEARQEEFLEAVENRIDRLLGEVASLDAIDAELAAEIAETESAISSELARIAAAEEAARRAAAGGGGPPAGVTFPTSGEIVNAGGIWVHQSIAANVSALLQAAAADGIVLAGGGYRSHQRQIELRRAHCGSSEYAIWQMPSYQCRPPTARPGRSNHERGLAIDFTYNGRGITSRSSPAYQWLAANAASYGLYNLPSEPWHWSVNGQ